MPNPPAAPSSTNRNITMPHVNITVSVDALNLALFGLAKLAESAQQASEVLRIASSLSIEGRQRSEEARNQAGAAHASAPAGAADSEGGEH